VRLELPEFTEITQNNAITPFKVIQDKLDLIANTFQTHSQQTDQYSLQHSMAQWQSEENVQEKAAFVSESQEVR